MLSGTYYSINYARIMVLGLTPSIVWINECQKNQQLVVFSYSADFVHCRKSSPETKASGGSIFWGKEELAKQLGIPIDTQLNLLRMSWLTRCAWAWIMWLYKRYDAMHNTNDTEIQKSIHNSGNVIIISVSMFRIQTVQVLIDCFSKRTYLCLIQLNLITLGTNIQTLVTTSEFQSTLLMEP